MAQKKEKGKCTFRFSSKTKNNLDGFSFCIPRANKNKSVLIQPMHKWKAGFKESNLKRSNLKKSNLKRSNFKWSIAKWSYSRMLTTRMYVGYERGKCQKPIILNTFS